MAKKNISQILVEPECYNCALDQDKLQIMDECNVEWVKLWKQAIKE